MKPSEILEQAKELIGEPERWTKFQLAVDASGFPVYPDSPTAVKYCAVGAIDKVCGLTDYAVEHYLDKAAEHWGDYSYGPDVNNKGNHLNALLLFDVAIDLAKEAGE